MLRRICTMSAVVRSRPQSTNCHYTVKLLYTISGCDGGVVGLRIVDHLQYAIVNSTVQRMLKRAEAQRE
jgi:hypothetical protein